jgi:hypothetical protein
LIAADYPQREEKVKKYFGRRVRMRKLVTFCAVVSVILLSTSVATAINTVEPDAYPAGTDISNLFWGVSLSALGGGWSSGGPAVLSIDPSGRPREFDPSTGDRVFGTDDGDYPHLFWGPGPGGEDLYLRADFTSALATEVSIDVIGISSDFTDIGELKAYDAADTLLDSDFSGPLSNSEVETLTVSDGGGIAYILAFGHKIDDNISDSIGLDNMTWTAIPAPGAILLGSIGIGLVGWLRRRRTL